MMDIARNKVIRVYRNARLGKTQVDRPPRIEPVPIDWENFSLERVLRALLRSEP